ncbi:hypothetical protein ACO22_04631 [Paracoccidioides brasiliensis]|uniref:Uncharacterized protein n=1 Tax=Paracoccidioides brasiliensis TaxID=121759 RepID=A0A1D2JCN2_PARBR|nr:hypothetical protein ACO22_04631 [Paracoccidioides brasiliensis]
MALVTAVVAEVPNHHTQTISDISITIPIQVRDPSGLAAFLISCQPSNTGWKQPLGRNLQQHHKPKEIEILAMSLSRPVLLFIPKLKESDNWLVGIRVRVGDFEFDAIMDKGPKQPAFQVPCGPTSVLSKACLRFHSLYTLLSVCGISHSVLDTSAIPLFANIFAFISLPAFPDLAGISSRFLKSVSTEKQKGQRRGSSIEHMPFTQESIITYEVHIKSKGEVGGGQRRVGWGEI